MDTRATPALPGYAAITAIEHDPETGEAFGVATNTDATRYPWGVERFEEAIEHRTSDANPAHTSVVGRYKLTEELEGRIIDRERSRGERRYIARRGRHGAR